MNRQGVRKGMKRYAKQLKTNRKVLHNLLIISKLEVFHHF